MAYILLQHAIIRNQGPGAVLAAAVGGDLKGKLSPILYVLVIPATFVHPGLAGTFFAAVALLWLLPDRRIERANAARRQEDDS